MQVASEGPMVELPERFRRWLPRLEHRIWILAAGRLLSQIGIGFTLFYAPIFFVNQVGLSATQVGLGLGSQSISGIAGRFLGGSLSDSPSWGRRPVLLWSAVFSAVADGVLVFANDFPAFVVGNLLMGIGIGLYWPATEAVVADLTTEEQRNEAFAVVRLADSIGLGVGVALGGGLISLTALYRALFVVDGVTYLLFFAIIYFAIHETFRSEGPSTSIWQGWGRALCDRNLLIYVGVNVLFTGYLSQVQSTLPVYFNRFVGNGDGGGLSEGTLSILFVGHIALAIICQMPIARRLSRIRQPQALMVSALLWGMGFTLVGLAGFSDMLIRFWAGGALGVMALAMVAYTPVASALVVILAPPNQRGVYLSINSMCWAIGYLIGPPIGGWALDQGTPFADSFWLILALSVIPGILVLQLLDRRLLEKANKS